MASSPMRLPQRPGGMGETSPTSMQDLVGGPPSGPEGNQQSPSVEQQMQQVMARVREAHEIIEGLSRQYPSGSTGARKAKEGLIEMMNSIVSSQKAPEQQGPSGPA
jgi:hypothetical protein